MDPDFERRGSKYNIVPRETFAGFVTFAASIGVIGSDLGLAAVIDSAMEPIKMAEPRVCFKRKSPI